MKLFRKHKLTNVFTPSTIAKLTYIERKELENDLKKFLELPGMQIVLYGHSGCGKSTLINNKLEELKIKSITTRCDSSTTFNDIIIRAFDKLNVFYNCERTNKSKATIKNEISSMYSSIGAKLSSEISSEESSINKRVLPLLLTPQRLAEFIGEANCVWIIEDFHKVATDEKKKIADILKIFIDTSNEYRGSNMKIICIGAVGTARELVELDPNLSTRIAEIYVPLLKEDELSEIAEKGFKLLNINHNGSIKDKIVYYSNNLASICHQICYDICYNKEITKTRTFPVRIYENDFKQSISSHVRKNTDTFTKIYDKVCTNSNNKNIIISIIHTEKEYCSDNEIHKEFKKIQNAPKSTFIECLNELCTINFDEILRFDRNSKRYSFSSPFFQAFVKMKLALEKLENEERNVRKARKYDLRNDVYDINIFNEDFYYQELDTFYLRRIAEIERIKTIEEKRIKTIEEKRKKEK